MIIINSSSPWINYNDQCEREHRPRRIFDLQIILGIVLFSKHFDTIVQKSH